MTVGETMKLTATVSSDGTVTALSVGRLYIICTTEDQEKTDRCMIDVEAPVVKVTGVSFDIKEIIVNEGDSFTLKPVFKPSDATDKGVTWESDDPAIASVNDEGVVTAVKTGATKSFVKASNLKIESSDPTTAVVDSYTDTECLVRIKKNGLASLACHDVSAGVDCYINNVLIASSN